MVVDWSLVIAHLPNALMVLDRELRYVAANPAYLRITGSTLESLVGRYIFDAFPDDPNSPNAAMLRASFARVLETRQPDEVPAIEYRVAREPGGPPELRIWSARHTPILDERGRVQLVIQETTDVTHLQAAKPSTALETTVLDRALRAQTVVTSLDAQLRDLRQMFAQAPGFMAFTRGREHVFTIVNAAYQQLVGHRDVVGTRVAEALPEVVEQGFVALLDRVFDSGEPFIGRDVPVKLQRVAGGALEDRYLDFVYQPIRDETGRVAGIFVQGQDVSDVHRAERRRADAEARQQFLIESIPVQIWSSTADGKLDFVSPRVIAYFERSAEQILGDGWLAVIHPDDAATVTARWTHSLTTGEPYEVEFRLRRGDGAYRWHLARANPERDAAGAITGWFGTNTDIHDAKARSEYEQRLLGIVSHDLRNPLNAIALGSAILAERAQEPQTKKIVSMVTRAANRATRLIGDLLDYAKARVGASIPISPGDVNLREVIEEVVDELRVSVPARAIHVEHTGDETGRWDGDRIAQVISNLVGNALQHGSSSDAIIVASRIERDEVVLAVTNHGPTIPPGDLEHLFEPFARAHNAAPGAGSLGLGLYIAREVVVAHGGRIDVESHDDVTRFTVHMPRFV